MNRMPIGIIDASVDGLYILNSLTKEFKNENFIYINDIKNFPYEGKDVEIIQKYVKDNVEKLNSFNIKMLIVISDTIVEYCSEYLQTLKIPVINVVQSIIKYTNENYEQKNIVFCAKSYILKANLYQKYINYNHLYNISSDELESIIIDNKFKTSRAFSVSEDTFKSVSKKDCDILVITSPWIELLKIEISEFLEVDEIIKLGDVFSNEIRKLDLGSNSRGKGKITVISNVTKKEFKSMIKWFNLKYKYLEAEKLDGKTKEV